MWCCIMCHGYEPSDWVREASDPGRDKRIDAEEDAEETTAADTDRPDVELLTDGGEDD